MAQYHRNDTAGTAAVPGVGNVTFRSLAADFAALRAAAPPGVVDTSETRIGTSEQGRDIHVLRLGKNRAMPVLIAGCHHAREWISVEMPFLFADFLIRNYSSDPRIQRLVDSRDLWIVPIINPDGHEKTVTTDRLWRTNDPPAGREAVDLNRNYETTFWSIPTGSFSDSPGDSTYRGGRGGYAKEVREMQRLVRSKAFKASLDFHARGRWVLFPWAGRTDAPPPLQEEMATAYERVANLRGDPAGRHYTRLQASGLYPLLTRVSAAAGRVPGGLMDYVLEQVSGSIALTIELDPDPADPRGFILPDSEIDPVFEVQRAAMLTFVNLFPSLQNVPSRRSLVLREGVDEELAVALPDLSRAVETL
jgi:carboxypeptidase T